MQREEIDGLKRDLKEQGIEAQNMARAAMEVRAEDVEQLVAYKEENARLIIFATQIAESHSKFAKEARHLLGM